MIGTAKVIVQHLNIKKKGYVHSYISKLKYEEKGYVHRASLLNTASWKSM